MGLKDFTKADVKDMAFIDLATYVLEDENKALDFRKIFDRIAKLKGLSETEKDDWIAQFYTDLNIDGRFMTKGSNLWGGLKKWYPVEEIDEDITPVPKKKKKKKAAKKKKAPIEEIDETDDLDETAIDTDVDDFDDDDLDTDDDIVDDDFDFDDDDLEDDDDFDTEDDDDEEDEEK
ncbi:phage protein [Gracilibacillus boraciitolerans JCM 21714]|uniref:Probable DNA-directed RNA polymerase subunit delta n=1 Tax=Gracilibacillus boraciitolerans JCM 21714 TaxID=1298598 RepID=W4VH56_9BACI|nr:DNA-directed RNA polymerase subunit delta [Gracilibacillus boraciitolerans]GAE92537.1 phage protein [Gracilibacillus boraciitolerans JCM 21714]